MITEKMVWMATLTYIDSLQNAEFWRLDLSKPEAMRSALEAVLPMIRAEVLEECAKVADYGVQRAYRDFNDRKMAEGAQAMAAEILEAIRAMKGDAT
jgi:hypothetical protein